MLLRSSNHQSQQSNHQAAVNYNCLGPSIELMPTVALNLVLPEPRVFSGEFLSATVLLDSSDPDTVVHEFYAEVRGTGRTGWVNIHTDKIYETAQEYLNVLISLCQQRTPAPLAVGRHKFPIRIAIPESVPSSYESQFGSVRYSIKVTLISNTDQASATEIFPFLVLAKSFFDDIPLVMMRPIDYKDEIDFTVCSLPFGTVYLTVSLPRTGFCLGETMNATVTIRNQTRKSLKDCRLQLLQKTQFSARSRYEHASDRKLIETVVDVWPIGRVGGRTEKVFSECLLRVPEEAVPTQQQCMAFNPENGGGPIDYRTFVEDNGMDGMGGTAMSMQPAIIAISYVLHFSALPGIETEIPLIVTCLGTRKKPSSTTETFSISPPYLGGAVGGTRNGQISAGAGIEIASTPTPKSSTTIAAPVTKSSIRRKQRQTSPALQTTLIPQPQNLNQNLHVAETPSTSSGPKSSQSHQTMKNVQSQRQPSPSASSVVIPAQQQSSSSFSASSLSGYVAPTSFLLSGKLPSTQMGAGGGGVKPGPVAADSQQQQKTGGGGVDRKSTITASLKGGGSKGGGGVGGTGNTKKKVSIVESQEDSRETTIYYC